MSHQGTKTQRNTKIFVGADSLVRPLTKEDNRWHVGTLRYAKIIERINNSKISFKKRCDDTIKFVQLKNTWNEYQNEIRSSFATLNPFLYDLERLVPINDYVSEYAVFLRDLQMLLNPEFTELEQRYIDALRDKKQVNITYNNGRIIVGGKDA